MLIRCLFVIGLTSLSALAQLSKLSEQLGQLNKGLPVAMLKLKTEPADAKVRPLESITVQVLAYGKGVEETTVRLRRTGAKVKASGGWVSKAFAFQGEDTEKYYDEKGSGFMGVFQSASSQYVVKDAFLYTAPEQPGKYSLEAELDGVKGSLEIEVSSDAPSRAKPEKQAFEQEKRAQEPYRALAERYAPFVAQETWWQPKSDTPTRFDFDGDWRGDNNWDNLEAGTSQAYLYYAAMETATHWFLIYNVFHPRDYSDRCVVGTCHENDNEGLVLTIRKNGSEFGKLECMETLAHNNVYSFVANPAIRNGIHDVDGSIELFEGTHPVIFIESGGHGIYGSRSTHARFSLERNEFLDSTGVTLVYKGVAERPKHANDRLVGYDLLPIYDQWWVRAAAGKSTENTYDSYFSYQPAGGRPGLNVAIGGSFFGRKESENKAKPFWGWHDTRTLKAKVLSVGQWGLDPAYAVSQDLRFPGGEPFSLDYIYNPYLGIDKREGAVAIAASAPLVSAPHGATPAAAVVSEAAVQGPASGAVDITITVDGVVDIVLAGGNAEFVVRNGQPPTGQKATFSAAMPDGARKVLARKVSGRGSVSLLEMPTGANGNRTVLRVEDPKGGAAAYQIRVDWER